jgi:hypothetical protein
VRKTGEVREAEQEFFDRVWYHRKVMHALRENEPLPPGGKFKDVERRYGKDTLTPLSDFQLGMISGKLSALRWVLGDEWDFLDT